MLFTHLKIWTLFQRARVSGLHLLLRSLAFTCLSSRSTLVLTLEGVFPVVRIPCWQLLAVLCVRLSLFMRTSAYRSGSLPAASIRTQTRPAIEFDSGEEGLRPEALPHRVFFRRVRLHGRPKVCNGPLAPIVGQRGDGDVGASPRSACERYVRCALPVCSLCLIMFSFPQCRLIIDPPGSVGLR